VETPWPTLFEIETRPQIVPRCDACVRLSMSHAAVGHATPWQTPETCRHRTY
jgi:hypothetical protein